MTITMSSYRFTGVIAPQDNDISNHLVVNFNDVVQTPSGIAWCAEVPTHLAINAHLTPGMMVSGMFNCGEDPIKDAMVVALDNAIK